MLTFHCVPSWLEGIDYRLRRSACGNPWLQKFKVQHDSWSEVDIYVIVRPTQAVTSQELGVLQKFEVWSRCREAASNLAGTIIRAV